MKIFGKNLKKLKAWLQRPPSTTRPENTAAARDLPDVQAGLPTHPPKSTTERPPPQPRPVRKTAPQTSRPAGEPIPAPSVAGRPLSRRGIPMLKPDEDLAVHFSDASPSGTHAAQGAVNAGEPAIPADRSANRPAPSSEKTRRNRVGIRRLNDDSDLREYFQDPASDVTASQTPNLKAPSDSVGGPRESNGDIPTDRHGIPRLDNGVDLNQLFDAASGDTVPDSDLGEALRQSLAHDTHGLIKKKTGGIFPTRRLSPKEKLRRYPPPQAQVDLHGDSALIARQRAEAFIRAARAEGLFTLRIIVGKGLHSQGGAVLPDVIEDLTVALKRRNEVLAHRWEKRVKRKSGALIVYLATDFD